jgi:hypothetical protein
MTSEMAVVNPHISYFLLMKRFLRQFDLLLGCVDLINPSPKAIPKSRNFWVVVCVKR